MKKAALFCDPHAEDGEEVLAVERVKLSTLTSGGTHTDVCPDCLAELLNMLPPWLTIEKSNGESKRRKRFPRPTSKAQARDENQRRLTSKRWVICNRCDAYVPMDQFTGHNTNNHNGAARDYREV